MTTQQLIIAVVSGVLGVWLTPHVARFFAKRPRRFMIFLLIPAAIMLAAMIESFIGPPRPNDQEAPYIFLACFLLLGGVAMWYARRIRNGSWQQFWIKILRQMGGDL